jgi:competence protein ComEC
MFLREETKIKILGFLFVIAVVVWIFVFVETGQSKFLEIDFFDVGQGDSIFIETMDKKQILIDGGPDLSVLEKIGRAMSFYDRYIDIVVLTHPEQDHLNGLIEILKRYNVGTVITSGIIKNTDQYKEFIKIIKEKNIPIYIAKLGGEINFGDNIKLNILYPFESIVGKEASDVNNFSVVSQLIYNNFKLLLTGDIEKSVENKLIKSGLNLQSDVLKIAHHGSKTSTSDEFLKKVDALLAIILVGKDNKYGHPHQEVLDRLKNILTLKTGDMGDIEILSNGEEFFIKK